MSCKEAVQLMCEYLDGRLSPTVVRDLRGHLDKCPNCRMVLDAARRTLETYFGADPAYALRRKSKVA